MATWEDGPEYAPVIRPDAFAEPDTAPLSMAPPHEQEAASAPKERPAFDDPPDPVAPLESLVPPVEKQRDPSIPFQVVSTALTSADSAWGAAHWRRPPSPPDNQWSIPSAEPAPVSWPPPTEPLGPVSGPPPTANGFPTPGTAQWFAPAPDRQPAAPAPVNARRVLETATPGVCISLVIGGLVYVVSPIMLSVAFVLSSRILVAQAQIRRTFITALTALGVFALLGLLTQTTSFGDWWSYVATWSLVINWITLIVVLVIVYRELKRSPDGGQAMPPPQWR